MGKVKSLRMLAAERGEMRYMMTKPCKRGHLGERYTSCGLCCDCITVNQQEIKNKLGAAKSLANTKQFEPANIYSALVRPGHQVAFDDLAQVCFYGTPDQIDQCMAFIGTIAAQLPQAPAKPRPAGELTRAALAAAACLDATSLVYSDGTPLRERQDTNGRTYIQVGTLWYDAVRMLALWRNERMNIQHTAEKDIQ